MFYSRSNKTHKPTKRINRSVPLDPACGSGNFLTETFLCLRRLEDDIIRVLNAGQVEINFGETSFSNRISLNQFYGIEINDFAVSVANVALWIARLQSDAETEMSIDAFPSSFPLVDSAHIVEGNALRMDWNDVLPASECNYIIGNPPFVGARNQTKKQKQEVINAFHGAKNCGNVDYVAGWYAKAADYIEPNSSCVTLGEANTYERSEGSKIGEDNGGECHQEIDPSSRFRAPQDDVVGYRTSKDDVLGSCATEDNINIRCAFVSTNSICQGEQVANVWKPIFDAGFHIDFAHNAFRWTNEAKNGAHVFCVIVGFSKQNVEKRLFLYKTSDSEAIETKPENINAYLVDASDAFIWNISKPLCNVPKMGIGNKPIDGGFYLFKEDEKEDFVKSEPKSASYFHPWLGSEEFINAKQRYVLWLGDATPPELQQMPKCLERVRAVRDYRLASKSKPTQKLADTPTRFHVENMPEGNSIVIPETSSERRSYVPMGFVSSIIICSNAVKLVPNATLYHFGILSSQTHNAWMRVVCGRLENRYRYSAGIVYNNFPWPGVTKETLDVPVEDCVSKDIREKIEACTQNVLDAREFYKNQAQEAGATCSLADMYDPNNDFIYTRLTSAHAALDKAVEAAYGVNFNSNEEQIVAHLFTLYEALTTP